MIAKTVIIHPGVVLGKNVTIGEFCEIGVPFKGHKDDIQTVIGDNAIIRSFTVIYAGNKIGDNFQTGHKANIRELNTIGNDVSIGTLSVIEHHVVIEDGVRIHTQVFIPEFSTLKMKSWVGPNVVFTNALYPQSPEVKNNLIGPTLGVKSIVGANSTLLPGVIIGDEAIIGAGSVVTKNVPLNEVWVGNPARKIKNKNELPY